jgi:DNA-binding LacI/PurR family transcriptional regulator
VHEILSHSFDKPRMPLVTKMASHYGVTVRTLRKTLGQLVSEGFLVEEGRGYRIAASHHGTDKSIVFVSHGSNNGLALTGDPRTQSLVEGFEQECAKQGMAFSTFGYGSGDPNDLVRIQTTLNRPDKPLGFVLSMWNPKGTALRLRLELIGILLKRKLPVIVIDQSGGISFPEDLLRNRSFRVLRISGIRAGEIVAQALHRHGHKHVAYVTPFFNFEWAKNRYAGLCRYFRQYCESGAIELHELHEVDDNDFALAMLGLDRRGIESLYREKLSREEMAGLLKQFDQTLKNGIPDKIPQNDLVGTIHIQARALSRLSAQDHDPLAFANFLDNLLTVANEAATKLYLSPFFERILNTSRASAWVCSDHRTTLCALDFLKQNKKNVPAQLSVVGFDNFRDSLAYGVSVYDFNMNGMVHQALHLLVDPKAWNSMPAISEVDGYVVERRTTKKQ